MCHYAICHYADCRSAHGAISLIWYHFVLINLAHYFAEHYYAEWHLTVAMLVISYAEGRNQAHYDVCMSLGCST